MGGEQPTVKDFRNPDFGSSPHGRGTDRKVAVGIDGIRFIPAWAGNRLNVSIQKNATAVHPRMGGEQVKCQYSEKCYCGSSPHGRGTVA